MQIPLLDNAVPGARVIDDAPVPGREDGVSEWRHMHRELRMHVTFHEPSFSAGLFFVILTCKRILFLPCSW